MAGQEKWEQGLWRGVEELFQRLAPHLEKADCTIIADSAFGCFAMVSLCVNYGWHSLFRIGKEHTCEHWASSGRRLLALHAFPSSSLFPQPITFSPFPTTPYIKTSVSLF